MMGVPVNNTVFIYRDKQSLLWNMAGTDSTLKKKSSIKAYHFVRESVASKEWITGYTKTSEKNSDLTTNTLSPVKDRERKITQLMHDINLEDNVGSF